MGTKLKVAAGVACGAVLSAGATMAVAAIPGANGSIKGCYATTNGVVLGVPHSKGDVRIVDSSEACRVYEKALMWNQQGAPGLPGTNGTNGVDGKDGISGFETRTATYVVAPHDDVLAHAECTPGKVATGGGYSQHAEPVLDVTSSYVSTALGWGWSAFAANPTDTSRDITVYVICMTAS